MTGGYVATILYESMYLIILMNWSYFTYNNTSKSLHKTYSLQNHPKSHNGPDFELKDIEARSYGIDLADCDESRCVVSGLALD